VRGLRVAGGWAGVGAGGRDRSGPPRAPAPATDHRSAGAPIGAASAPGSGPPISGLVRIGMGHGWQVARRNMQHVACNM
jgi:hypothetical protein